MSVCKRHLDSCGFRGQNEGVILDNHCITCSTKTELGSQVSINHHAGSLFLGGDVESLSHSISLRTVLLRASWLLPSWRRKSCSAFALLHSLTYSFLRYIHDIWLLGCSLWMSCSVAVATLDWNFSLLITEDKTVFFPSSARWKDPKDSL